jgi:hypothetical protein
MGEIPIGFNISNPALRRRGQRANRELTRSAASADCAGGNTLGKDRLSEGDKKHTQQA